MGAYISLSSEISRRALIGAWALKVMNTVRKFNGTNCQITGTEISCCSSCEV